MTLYAYASTKPDEISFAAGEVLRMVPSANANHTVDGWVLLHREQDGTQGLAPLSYVDQGFARDPRGLDRSSVSASLGLESMLEGLDDEDDVADVGTAGEYVDVGSRTPSQGASPTCPQSPPPTAPPPNIPTPAGTAGGGAQSPAPSLPVPRASAGAARASPASAAQAHVVKKATVL